MIVILIAALVLSTTAGLMYDIGFIRGYSRGQRMAQKS